MSMRFNVVVASSIAVLFLASLVLGAPYLCRAEQIKSQTSEAVYSTGASNSPQWASDGRIFFSHYGTVYAVNIDGTQLDVIDGNRLKDSEAAAWPSISPDGSKVTYSHFSPIGRFIWSSENNWRIVVANFVTPFESWTTGRWTTDDYLRATNVVWLSDNKIAFIATIRVDGSYRRLPFVADVGPTGEISREAPLYTEGPRVKGPLVPSPDGRLIAFINLNLTDRFEDSLYVIGADGSHLTKLDDKTSLPAWHPSGNRIAYAVRKEPTPGDPRVATGIFTIRPDGTDRREVISFPEPGILWTDGLIWHPDGSALYFASHIIAADGSEMRVSNLAGGRTTFSPNGIRAAYHYSGRIVSTLADGSNPKILTEPIYGVDIPYLVAPARGRPLETE